AGPRRELITPRATTFRSARAPHHRGGRASPASFSWSMILLRKPVPTFRDHALWRHCQASRPPLAPAPRQRGLDDSVVEFRGREVAARGDDRMTYVGAGAVAPEGRQSAQVGVRGVELEGFDRGAVAGEPARELLDQRLGERTGIGGTAACA